MITEAQIEDEVFAALDDDPRIPAPAEIAIVANGDEVTLRGTVGSFAQRRHAVKDAEAAVGVDYVYDELKVRLLDELRREDAELRGAALQRLMWDVDLPQDSVDVAVADGWVTLSGTVGFQYQSDAAFEDVATLVGVTGITNEIVVEV